MTVDVVTIRRRREKRMSLTLDNYEPIQMPIFLVFMIKARAMSRFLVIRWSIRLDHILEPIACRQTIDKP